MEPNTQSSSNMGSHKSYTPWIVFVILIILICAGVYYFGGFNNPHGVKPLPIGYKANALTDGQYPAGFPKSLVVSGGVWQRSEDTVDGSGHQIKTVELVYKNTVPATLLASFEKSFKADGWTAAKVQSSEGSSVENFTKGFNTVTVLILPRGADAFVNVTQYTK